MRRSNPMRKSDLAGYPCAFRDRRRRPRRRCPEAPARAMATTAVSSASLRGQVGRMPAFAERPELIRAMNLEFPGGQRMDRPVMVAAGRLGEAPAAARIEVVQLHQAPDLFAVHNPATMARFGSGPTIAVAFPGVRNHAHR